MSMSLEEQQQSVESQPLSSASNTTKSDTPNQSRHQQTEPSLNHHNTEEYRNLSPTANQSYQAPIINSTRSQHPQTDIMAMHNFGPNSSQHEHQLKNQQTSGTDSSSWHNNTSNNNNNSNSGGSSNNTNNDSPSTMSNTDHATDLQQSSGVSNLNEQKLQATESPNPKGQTNSRSTLNRHQQQQQQSQLQSQSQQYHGIFTPQIPAILHSSLASRVDQIIRTTLHDSPAYTPQTSRNNVNTNINVNGADNSTNTLNSIPSSNMPLSSSSSSHIFNTAAGSVSTSVPQSISSHMVANTCGGPMSAVTTTAPITSIYGSTLSTISDNPNNTPNSNLVAKTSPSHSALAAAAALQSLNQAHVQRSHQQQMAHTQSSPFSSVSGLTTKPPSNGTPVPQAAHGGSIHQMSKLNPTSMANLEQQNQLSFASDHSSSGSLNFSSRLHPNNLSSGNNLSSKMVNLSNTGSSSMNWQDQMQANGMLSRLPPLHGLNGSMPPFLTSSQGPYGVVSSQLLGGLGSNNGNNMIGTDGDTLSKLNLMKNSPGHNPMQFRDEKSFPMNFPNLISNKQNQSDIENLRGPSQNPSHDTTLPKGVTNERLVVFAYNLLSQGIPGKQQPKKVVHLDDGMRTAIQNGEFYSKYSAIANGIISNQMIVPNFSIIDYLRKDKFHMTEIDAIERINSGLGICDLLCLMELVKQRPWPSEKSGSDLSKSSQYPDMSSLHTGNLMSSSQPDHSALLNHHNSPQKVNFLSTSPERSELLGLQGVDRSRRSSQSPSQMSNTNLKFMNAHNSSLIHQQQSPAINPHIFTSPLCPPSQQQHTSPQANRSSPFQPPMSVGSSHSIARPPRSHSTIVGHGTSPLNPPYSLTPSLARPPPPAAHQSSSRPNLAVLDMQPIPAHSGVTSVPVTAHMSSKLPQTPKLQDSLPRPNSKSSQQIYQPFVNPKLIGKETTLPSHLDFQNPSRFELDPNQVLSIQATNGPRQQDLANRDLKRSTTPHYIPNNMLSGVNQVDFVRQHELSDGSMGTQQHMSQLGMSNYTANARGLFDRNLSQVNNSNSTMPPPSTSNTTNDLNCRGQSGISGSDTKQYNALVAAYQQQIMMSRKLGDNHPGALNVMGSVPGYMVMNQPGSQRLPVGEPMHVDILQQARQPATQMNSPKSNNQRSIITGSGAGPARKTKKPKSSPPTGAQPLDGNTAMNESLNSTNTNVSLSDSSGSVTHGAMPIQTKENQTDRTNIQEVNQPSNDSLTDNIELGAGNAIAISGAETVRMESVPSEISALTEISARGCGNTGNDQTKNHVDLTLNLRQTGADDILNPTANVEINVNIKEIQSEPSSESAKLNPSVHAGPNSTVVDQPSKYQKLFTKKAWLKNYDLEDQARSIEETAAADETMPALTRNSVKIEDKPKITTDESVPKEDKPQSANVKGVSGTKNGKTKADNKKKAKDSKAAKSNATCSLKSNKVASIKNTDNDSEETNASTSDLDDTDETDSVKSTNDKKLRRMPRRKVKLSSDREFSDSASASNKAKAAKDVSDKESSVRGRVKKEKVTGSSSDALPSLTKRKHNSDDESVKHKVKKIKESNKHTDKSNLSPVSKAKKRSGEKFLQTQPCYEILPKSSRCLECRRVRQSSLKGDKTVQSKQASKTNWDDFCRFFEFRKLRYNKSAQIVVAGFSEATDAKDSDMRLWLPLEDGEVPKNISYKVAKFILANIGDEFCKIVLQERAALKSYESTSGKKTTWKRAVYGLRELCDVCSTTLFNCHYVCDRCGFVVCLDCHETRSLSDKGCDVNQDITEKDPSEVKVNCENNNADTEQTNVSNKKSKKDSRGWIFCAKNEEHSDDRLTLTKIIAGNCLEEVWALMHEIREKLNLGECSCAKSNNSFQTSIENVEKEEFDSSIVIKQEIDDKNESSHSTLKGLLLASNDSPMNGSSDSKQNNILKMDAKAESKISDSDVDLEQPEMDFGSEDDSRQVSAAIEGCIASLAADVGNDTHDDKALNSNIDSNSSHTSSKLCHGDLLVLSHSHHKDNVRLFREHWRLGKPVLVRGVHDRMNIDMWLPQFFLGKFGDYRSDLVDCRNGDIHRQSMRKYWDGFEPSSTKKKSKDDITPSHIPPANNEEPSAITTSYYSGTALWRLKDWPPGQDFNEILPEHYYDFMSNLPLKSYTTRSGKLNLACRLPKEMLKPDLGPKMYSAYGTTRFPERGTTNLHLDISDAVNVMIYVGGAMPFKQGSSDHAEIYDNTINDCFVDTAMKDQIRQQKLIPGALWHIFKPTDAEKMREFLNMVSDECKISHEKRIDPIHDQTWYLDQNLLDRLQREYGVKSYPILQCMGDAILIPAGAPHQVKNLQNCIKVANDFVSPENIRYCLKLTNEFRNLPETHINQEDKLQIKNIMYHSVKESIQYIKMFESGKVTLDDESSDEDDCSDVEYKTNQPDAS